MSIPLVHHSHAPQHRSLLLTQQRCQPELFIHSGITTLDRLLGGFKAGQLIAIDGTSDLIKDLPDRLCASTYHTFKSTTLYLDGGMQANPYQLASYARKLHLNQHHLLKHVYLCRAFTVYQLTTLVEEYLEPMIKQITPRTLIIGMFPTLFFDPDVPAKEATALLTYTLQKLNTLTTTYRLITLLTHHSKSSFWKRRPLKPLFYQHAHEVVSLTTRHHYTHIHLLNQNTTAHINHCHTAQKSLDDFTPLQKIAPSVGGTQ